MQVKFFQQSLFIQRVRALTMGSSSGKYLSKATG